MTDLFLEEIMCEMWKLTFINRDKKTNLFWDKERVFEVWKLALFKGDKMTYLFWDKERIWEMWKLTFANNRKKNKMAEFVTQKGGG